MNYSEVMRHYKTPAAAGKAIGFDRQRIHAYKGKPIPLAAQVEWEIDSEGELKADLPECIRDGDYKGEKKKRLREDLRAVG